jgi:hypothetical protein
VDALQKSVNALQSSVNTLSGQVNAQNPAVALDVLGKKIDTVEILVMRIQNGEARAPRE